MSFEPSTDGVAFGPRSLGELVRDHGGAAAESDHARVVRRLVSPENAARDDDLVVVTSIRGARAAADARGVILCQREIAPRCERAHWVHDHAMWVVARLLRAVEGEPSAPGIDPAAWVDPGATVHPSARVRRGAVVRAFATIGPGADVGEGAVIYGRVRIGERVAIGPLAVIGRPGFGFATGPDGVERIPQLGGVLVEDDVEIGALCTVDAGTLSPTVLRRGAKLDAHVHVAHNVEIGEGSFIAAQAGFAGSARLGPGVLVGGQAGVKDHARVGAGARIGAKSGVIGDVAPGAVVAGFPAVPRLTWLRAWAKLLGSGKRSDE